MDSDARAGDQAERGLLQIAGPLPIRSAMLGGLFLLAVLYTAYFAAALIIPVTLAILLQFLFAPVVTRLARRGVPRAVAAGSIVLVLVAASGGVLYALAEPAAEWIRAAPISVGELREKLRAGRNPLAEVREAGAAVAEAVEEITGSGDRSQAIQVVEEGVLESTIESLPFFIGSIAVTLALTFFLLVSSDSLLRKLTSMGGKFSTRRRIVVVIRQIEREIARYLGTVTAINVALGLAVAGAMHLIGLPNPWLWGLVAGVLNFAPYVGAVVTTLLLFLAGASAFDTLTEMVAPPLTFMLLTILEGQVITPMLVGRRLELSPVVVFVSVLGFGWLWGIIGALIAVPIVASIKIFLMNFPRLRIVGILLSQ